MKHQATAWKSWFNWVIMPSTRGAWWQWQSTVQWFGGLAVSPAPGTPGPDELTELEVQSHPMCEQQDAEVLLCKRRPTVCRVPNGADASHSCATAHMQLLCACVAVIFLENVVPPAWNRVRVWGGGGRFTLNGSVYHPKAEAWQISSCRASDVTNQTLPEPWGSSFWENSEQSDPNPKKTVIPSGGKPKKMFTPALLHKARVLVLFYWQCSQLPGWKSRWRRSSASLYSHASVVSRIAVIIRASSKSLPKPRTI